MPRAFQESIHGIFDGSDRSGRARFLRAVTALGEPFYATAMRVRNLFYDRGTFQSHSLSRPTISVGNITTGGTGKTPVVAWLADRLREDGRRPGVLLRGYKSAGGISDEQQMLDRMLNEGVKWVIPVRANPSRVMSAAELLRERPEIDTFVLDDAFQHRRVRRDFDLVLINATEPFGFGHVLPRGLLREPLEGLRRAGAFLITRASQARPGIIENIRAHLMAYRLGAPIYCADHHQSAIRSVKKGERMGMESLRDLKFFAFCGIANPAGFDLQLRSLEGKYAGHRWFGDHHAYSERDIAEIREAARQVGANQILTTEKDWVKIAELPEVVRRDLAIGVIEMSIRFQGEDEGRLFDQIMALLCRDEKKFPTKVHEGTRMNAQNFQPRMTQMYSGRRRAVFICVHLDQL